MLDREATYFIAEGLTRLIRQLFQALGAYFNGQRLWIRQAAFDDDNYYIADGG